MTFVISVSFVANLRDLCVLCGPAFVIFVSFVAQISVIFVADYHAGFPPLCAHSARPSL